MSNKVNKDKQQAEKSQVIDITPYPYKDKPQKQPSLDNKPVIKSKIPLDKQLRNWKEYTHQLAEKGLKPRQIKAIKVFISQPVKSISDWSRKLGIAHQTLSYWWNHDQLFQECLADAADIYLDMVIPFGVKQLGERVMKGEESSLITALKLKGKLGGEKRIKRIREGAEIYKEWIVDD